MPILDLACEKGHLEVDVLVRSDGPTVCPVCGMPRHTSWASGKGPAFHGFRETTIDGMKFEDKSQLDRHRATVAANLKVPVEQIQVADNSDRHVRADFHRHRAWEKRKKNGLDEKTWKDIQYSIRDRGIDPRVA